MITSFNTNNKMTMVSEMRSDSIFKLINSVRFYEKIIN